MANPTSESIDDYLKAILELGGSEDDPVSGSALAERLHIKAASVTGMLQKLAAQKPALVLYEKHRGVKLSAAGKRRAWELVRHHRLLELFLHDVLKFSWDEVHEEAERLEHFISERFEDRIAAILGDPEIDPHGHPIPAKDELGHFPEEVKLAEWHVDRPAVIRSVSDHDPTQLRELERLNLRPGVVLTITQRSRSAALSIRIQGKDEAVRLNNGLASGIRVTAASGESFKED